MNKKFLIIIGLVLILFCSVLAISSFETNSTDDDNFTIPEGFHIKNQSDDYLLLESDKYHTISISAVDIDRDVLKYSLEKSMYDFTYEKNYTKGEWNIEENHYNYEYQRGILYFCENGDRVIVMDYKVPVIEEIDDSPVQAILDHLSA